MSPAPPHDRPSGPAPAPAEGEIRRGALVTGVSSPPGPALARALLSRGYAVHVTDLDERLAGKVAAELGPQVFASGLDVRSMAACRAAAARTRRRLGDLEVWVNNAFVQAAGPAWELDERSRQRMLETNVLGAVNGTLAALEVMRPEGQGHVINVVGLNGLLPAAGDALHGGTVQAVLAFSQAALADLGQAGTRGVHVSCLGCSRDGQDAWAVGRGLHQLLERPRSLVAVPAWRGTALRAANFWPSASALGRAALPKGNRRRRRRGAGPS